METITCSKCKVEKPVDQFGKRTKLKSGELNPTGKRSQCKQCESEQYKIYHLNNKEENNQYNRDYHKKNAEKIKQRKQPYEKLYWAEKRFERKPKIVLESLPENQKICTRCKIVRNKEDFLIEGVEKPFCVDCKEKSKQISKERVINFKRNNPKSVQRERLKRVYGLTLEQYEKMSEEQGHVCAVCKKPETRVIKGTLAKLAVDHDHNFEGQGIKVRGLLCNHHNKMLGMVNDSIELLQSMIDYLKKHQ